MELKEHLAVLAKREKSKVGNIIAAYEVKRWPEGRLDELVDMGMLISIENATTIKCPCCSKGCPVEPIRGTANDGTVYYEVLCTKEGSSDVDPFYLKQWQITKKIRRFLPKTLKRRKRKASPDLSQRETDIYRMVYAENKTPMEVAITFKCTAQNIYKHLHNAEKKLAAKNSRSISTERSQDLPHDKRGQESIEG
ncbi:MAG: helix-turn-helix transcriptional regulator [Planctomycetes bacterium]|nr:helix-turn-helix transcriptional regulator [Planctomycetota bacterium]